MLAAMCSFHRAPWMIARSFSHFPASLYVLLGATPSVETQVYRIQQHLEAKTLRAQASQEPSLTAAAPGAIINFLSLYLSLSPSERLAKNSPPLLPSRQIAVETIKE